MRPFQPVLQKWLKKVVLIAREAFRVYWRDIYLEAHFFRDTSSKRREKMININGGARKLLDLWYEMLQLLIVGPITLVCK